MGTAQYEIANVFMKTCFQFFSAIKIDLATPNGIKLLRCLGNDRNDTTKKLVRLSGRPVLKPTGPDDRNDGNCGREKSKNGFAKELFECADDIFLTCVGAHVHSGNHDRWIEPFFITKVDA